MDNFVLEDFDTWIAAVLNGWYLSSNPHHIFFCKRTSKIESISILKCKAFPDSFFKFESIINYKKFRINIKNFI